MNMLRMYILLNNYITMLWYDIDGAQCNLFFDFYYYFFFIITLLPKLMLYKCWTVTKVVVVGTHDQNRQLASGPQKKQTKNNQA